MQPSIEAPLRPSALHHGIDAGRLRRPQASAQVVRVGDPVEQEKQGTLSGLLPSAELIVEVGKRERLDAQDHALVMRHPGEPVEILSPTLPKRDAALFCQGHDFIDAPAAGFLVDKQFNPPAAAAQVPRSRR